MASDEAVLGDVDGDAGGDSAGVGDGNGDGGDGCDGDGGHVQYVTICHTINVSYKQHGRYNMSYKLCGRYNMEANGERIPESLHGACPTALGIK